MSRELIRAQAAKLSRPGSSVRCVDVGEHVAVILEPYAPANGEAFNPSQLEALLFLVPAAFDDAAPDPSGFYVKPASLLVRATNQALKNSGVGQPLPGESWLKLSWGLKGQDQQWEIGKDTLETYLATLEKRLLRGD